jgi:hypothetical protein
VRPKGGGIGIDDYTGYYAKHDKDSRCFIVAKLHDFLGFSFSFIAGRRQRPLLFSFGSLRFKLVLGFG